MPESGWLNRQFKSIKEDSKSWPPWMKEAAQAQGTSARTRKEITTRPSTHELRGASPPGTPDQKG